MIHTVTLDGKILLCLIHVDLELYTVASTKFTVWLVCISLAPDHKGQD